MADFDPQSFGALISELLLSKGTGLPPLQWHTRASKAARTRLDAADVPALFADRSVADAPAAQAVRGAMYLWHGFLRECAQECGQPDAPEHGYWRAFCLRNAGQPEAAKQLYRHIGAHPVYGPLGIVCRELIGVGLDRLAKRFLDTLNQVEAFEPYAFVDLYEMARTGQTCAATEQLVRTIQLREFHLLFTHCFKKACGASTAPAAAPSATPAAAPSVASAPAPSATAAVAPATP